MVDPQVFKVQGQRERGVGLPTIPNCPGHPEIWMILICPFRASSGPVFQSQPRRPIIDKLMQTLL